MKKRFLALLLALSFVVSTSVSVFARENDKSLVKQQTKEVKTSSKVNKEEREVDIIVSLKENSNPDFASLKTEIGKKARIEETRALRKAFKDKLDSLNIKYEIIFEYDFLFAGFALKTSNKNLKAIEKIDGVDTVEYSVSYSRPEVLKKRKDLRDLDSNNPFRSVDSNDLIKLSTDLQRTYNGQGRVVAVLDSGLDVNHPILRVSDVSKAKYVDSNSIESKKVEVGIDYGSWKNDKVVFVHDYFSNTDDVLQDVPESHGMHVSGSAVGNPEEPEYVYKPDGTKYSQYIKGTAPEAQLIFMKVFDDNERTYTHYYAKAVEDAVKLGADSVNLSLGIPNGTERITGKSMDKAIDFARSMGSVVTIAAGNQGHFGYRNLKPLASNPDYGTLGAPGVAKHALTVASVNTTVERFKSVEVENKGYKIGDTITKSKDFLDGQKEKEYDYVVVSGNGNESDYENLDVNGKVVLVQRGGIPNGQKVYIAQSKGAVGVIIYNNEAGGDEIIKDNLGIFIVRINIPTVFMGHNDGKKLVESNSKVVKFTSNAVVSPYAKGGLASEFSSYGYSTDGVFKPDISAPGGLIYSSINNGQYTVMDGTSMASPHVAGAIAIVRDALSKKLEVSGEVEFDLIRSLLMSTADPIYDEGSTNYVSPRKQGAGILNVEKALSTELYVLGVDENLPKVALKNLDSSVFEFTVKVVNFGNEDKSLNYKTYLGTDAVENGEFALKTRTLEVIEGSTITVPAKGEKEVTISVDASQYETELKGLMPNGYFLEGFVVFNDTNDDMHTVSIPFSGFRGDFDNLPIWEKPIYDFGYKNGSFETDEKPMYFENSRGDASKGVKASNATSLITIEDNEYAPEKKWDNGKSNAYGDDKVNLTKFVPAGFDFKTKSFLKDKIAFSPNGDDNKDTITFMGIYLRNAEYVLANVYKEGSTESVFTGEYPDYAFKNSNDEKTEIAEGSVFRGLDNEGNELPEGKYKYVVTANPTSSGEVQTLEFDILLDRTKPAIDKPVVENGVYLPSINDELSGVEDVVVKVMIDDELVDVERNEDGSFDIPEEADLSKSIVVSYDYAGNISKLHLDGTEVVEETDEEEVDETTGINPIMNVTNFHKINGDHIENSEKLNMFFKENYSGIVVIVNEEGDPVEPKVADGKYLLPAGNYMAVIADLPEFIEEIEPTEQEFTVEEGEFVDLEFNVKVKENVIEDNGGVNVVLLVDEYFDEGDQSLFSYVIVDEEGNVLNIKELEKEKSFKYSPIYNENGELVDIHLDRFEYYIIPTGNYKVKVTTLDEYLKLENKEVSFNVEEGKITPVVLNSTQIIEDRVRFKFEGLDELPEGIKVVLVNKETGEKTEIAPSRFNKKVFSQFIVNGEYTVEVEVPEGYELDKNNFDITIFYGKHFEVLKIRKKTEAEMTEPTSEVIKKLVGDEITEKEILDVVKNIPENAKVVVKTPVTTDSEGNKVAIVTVTYTDGSSEDVEVTVVVEKFVSSVGKPETIELPIAEIEEVPNEAPTVELPIAEIGKSPENAPIVEELPIAEVEKKGSSVVLELPVKEIKANDNKQLAQTGHGISSFMVMGIVSMMGVAIAFKKKND